MDSKVRSLIQGIVLLIVAPVGLLGLLAFATARDLWMSLMFGTVSSLAVALGVWLIWRSGVFSNKK
jgi:hypothetical protein